MMPNNRAPVITFTITTDAVLCTRRQLGAMRDTTVGVLPPRLAYTNIA